ncbi:MAG TPA: extracellular solute-binding protein [Thermomicrobiales bacterium]|nr:extracellular solute-binding protein [Thermomicrobiales bacterium]
MTRFDRRSILKAGAVATGLAAAARFGGSALAQTPGASPAASPASDLPTSGFDTSSLTVSKPVEIEYWQYQLDTKVDLVNKLIPEFEAANPNIKIKHVNYPYDDFRNQVAAGVQAGAGPDVLNLYYGWIPAYVQQQFLTAFPTDIFPTEQIEKEFYPTVATGKIQGSYYALPIAVRTLALFYNIDILDAAGVKPPTTWEELVDAAKATVKKNGNKFETVGFTWDIGGQGHNWWRESLIRQNGGVPISDDNKTLDWTSDEAIEAFNYVTAFLTDYDVTQNAFETDGPTAFGAGKAALHVDGSYRVGSLASGSPTLNYGVVPLPGHKSQASFASYWANSITRNAADGDKLAASAKWIDFLSSESVQKRWTPIVGELPARVSLADDPDLAANPKLKPFIDSLPYSRATFMVNEADLRQFVMDAFDNVTLNGVDPKSAIQEAQDKVQAELDDYWKTFG